MKYPSRDIVYEWGRTATEQLAHEADALDTKIIAIFTAGSVIIGVITALSNKIRLNYTIIPFVVACISFILIFIMSLWVIRAQWVFVADSPRILKEDYWKLEPDEAKEKYWNWLEKDYDKNYKIIVSKGKALAMTIPLLAIETLALLLWLFL